MSDLQTATTPGIIPELSETALTVLQSRYLIKDEEGKCIESPAQLFSRVASVVAEAEGKYGAHGGEIKQWHNKFYDLMASLKFLPNSPALINAGRVGTLSACFVLPIEDKTEAIFDTLKQSAMIQKAGGGTGFSFDKLRPTGDHITTGSGTTSGPLSFWRVFCDTTDALQQGSFNRGANMGMMSIEHPDILKFLHAKQNLKAFTNFNISVKITDEWMQQLLKSGSSLHIVKNPRTGQQYLIPKKIKIAGYTISDLHKLTGKQQPRPRQGQKFYTVSDIWKVLIKCAHKTGEPGVAFIDQINLANPTPSLGQIETTNPCGEQPLLNYEACTLGSINLVKFVTTVNNKKDMNWPELAKTVHMAVRFLDNVIDVCNYPVRETVQLAQGNRKIGLGVMGFADCLFMFGIPYDSEQGIEFGENLMKFINEKARQASNELANFRGPFPNWNNSIWRTERNLKVRNASITCIAPTGSISIIANCSAGIEPAYSLVFNRQILGKDSRKAGTHSKMLHINPVFKQVAEKGSFYTKKLQERIAKSGSIQKITTIPTKTRRIFRCAYDIKPEWHIRMQAAFQQHCDAAVSKTINLNKTALPTAVDEAFKLAYKLGCKGVTVYRQHSRDFEPMSLY